MKWLVGSAVLLSVSCTVPARADSYKITFIQSHNPDNKGQYRVAQVEAQITPTPAGIVGLFRDNDEVGLPNGWSTFLYKPSAHALDNKPLTLKPIGGGKIHVEGWRSGPIILDYAMLLQHDRFPNDPGDDELAYARNFGVMWTGRALLMEGEPANTIDVRFDTPREWTITTPWQKDPTDPHHFTVRSTDDLLDSAIMAGTQEQLVEPVGTAEARIGVDPAMHDEEAGLVKTLHQSINAYQTLFRDPPHDNVVILLSAAAYTGGGVMGHSISFLVDPDNPDLKDFHHILSHELFHLWTTQWDRTGVQSDTEWLVEGSAEYYSYLSGLRAGRLSQAEFLAEIAKRDAAYLTAIQSTSIANAGKTKLKNGQSSDAIYSGGMLTYFTLDALIRKHSHNRESLDDAMQALNARFKSKPATLAALSDLLSHYGVPLDFLRRYVAGGEPLPLAQAFSVYGLEQRPAPKRGDISILRFNPGGREQTDAWRRYTLQPSS